MGEKRFVFPWEKKYCIVCPKCGGRIETRAIWFWEKQKRELDRLQLWFCHALDSEFLKRIPELSENDWASKQRWDGMLNDLTDDFGRMKPYEELKKTLFRTENGLLMLFLEYGIFALILRFTKREIETLFLFLCIPGKCPFQVWFQKVMEISRSYVSTILKELQSYGLIEAWKAPVEGRAKGRQVAFAMKEKARQILEKDLRKHDFFREAVVETVKPIAEKFPKYPWRKDLIKTNNFLVSS